MTLLTISSPIIDKACKLAVAGALFALPLGPFAWSQAWASADSGSAAAVADDASQSTWSYELPSRVALNQPLNIKVKIPVPAAEGTGSQTSGSSLSAERAYALTLQYETYGVPDEYNSIDSTQAAKSDGYYVATFSTQALSTAGGGWAQQGQTRFRILINDGSQTVEKIFYTYIEPASRTVTFNSAVASDDIDQPKLDVKSIEATYGRAYSYDPTGTAGAARTLPTPTRVNYDFDGWYTYYNAKTGAYSGKVTDDTVFTGTSSTTLYAKWVGKRYEVLLLGDSRKDNRQGHIDVRSIYVTYGQTYAELAQVTGTGEGKYPELRGWTDYDGNAVKPTDKVVDKDPDHRIWTYGTQLVYAVWGEARESIDDAVISGVETSYPYKGKEITLPNIKVTLPQLTDDKGNVTRPEKTLVAGRDYTVEYKDNVEMTTTDKKATFVVTGAGKFKGSVSGSFDIGMGAPYFQVGKQDADNGASFDFSFSGSGTTTISSKLITDSKDKVSYSIVASDEDRGAVSIDENGVITATRPVDNVKVVATAIKGTKYDATPADGTFFILNVKASPINKMTITASAKSLVYSGKKQSPSITVKDLAGNVLKKDVDYKVAFRDDCKRVGAHKVRVTGLNGYNSYSDVSFTIVPKAPGKVKAKRYGATKSKGKKYGLYTLSWSKVSGADKYQVYRTVSSKTAKSTFSAKTLSKKFGWEKGKKVTVKVRAVQKVGKKSYYSAWKTITVKAK